MEPGGTKRGYEGDIKPAALLRDQLHLSIRLALHWGVGGEGESVSGSPSLLSFIGDVTGICEHQGAERRGHSLG